MSRLHFKRCALDRPLPADVERDWRAVLDKADYAGMGHDPDWLRTEFPDALDRTFGLLVYEDEEAVGLLTFTIKRWPLYLRIGEIKAVTIPIDRCCLLDEPIAPKSHALYDRIFEELMSLSWDVLYLEVVADDSFLHSYLETSSALPQRFGEYRPQGTMEHHQIHFPESLEAYWASFTPKTRRNLQRKVRKLGKDLKKEVRLQRVSEPADVPQYVKDAASVSRRSYQYHLLKQGIQDEAKFLDRCMFTAEKGWLRGYALYADEEPIAFMHGYQYRGVYLYTETAYDQELRKQGPGTVLHVMVIEEMLSNDTPRIFEFGVHGDQKAAFGNNVYRAGEVFLIRKALYPQLATGLYRASDRATDLAKTTLDRFGATKKVKQMMRRLSVRSA